MWRGSNDFLKTLLKSSSNTFSSSNLDGETSTYRRNYVFLIWRWTVHLKKLWIRELQVNILKNNLRYKKKSEHFLFRCIVFIESTAELQITQILLFSANPVLYQADNRLRSLYVVFVDTPVICQCLTLVSSHWHTVLYSSDNPEPSRLHRTLLSVSLCCYSWVTTSIIWKHLLWITWTDDAVMICLTCYG